MIFNKNVTKSLEMWITLCYKQIITMLSTFFNKKGEKTMALYTDASTVLNALNGQIRGTTGSANVDFAGLVAEAKTSLSSSNYKDEFMGSLLTMVTKFWNRYLSSELKYPLMNHTEDEFGAMLVKNDIAPFVAQTDTSTGTGSASYTPDWTQYSAPSVDQTYFVGRDNWSEKMKLPDDLLYTAFHNENEFAAFVGAIMAAFGDAQIQHQNKIQDMALLNFIGETVYANTQIVNLLSLYNSAFGTTETFDSFMTKQSCLQFAGMIIRKYLKYMAAKDGTSVFNAGHKVRRSDPDDLMAFFATDFVSAYDTYLLNGLSIFKTDLSELPGYYEVNAWQTTGQNAYDLPTPAYNCSIDIKTSAGNTVQQAGIVGALIDKRAVATAQTKYVSATDRFNGDGITFYTQRANGMYINDWTENGLVFIVA